jgi:hypothetical protein
MCTISCDTFSVLLFDDSESLSTEGESTLEESCARNSVIPGCITHADVHHFHASVTFKLLLQPMVLICSTLEAKDGMTVVPRHEGAVAKC